MSNSVELISTGQVVVQEVAEQVIELIAPAAPATVEVVTEGPQGAEGPVYAGLFDITDYDYVGYGYSAGALSSMTFREGGSGGTIQRVLTVAYDGGGNLSSVTGDNGTVASYGYSAGVLSSVTITS